MEGHRRKPRRHTLSIHKFGMYTTDVKERIERRERLELRDRVKDDEHLGDTQGVKRRDKNENVFARPNGLRANVAISGIGPARKKRYTSSWEEEGDA